MKIVHIGYGDSAASCLKEAMLVHGLEGSTSIPSRDDFTQGPISECDSAMDTTQRQDYWKMIDAEVDFGMDIDLFYQESMLILDQVDECEVVLWQGDSCHDILATAWLITYFEGRDIQWSIIDLGRLSPEEKNDDLPAVNLAMFSPYQVASLYQYKQKIEVDTRQIYKDLWSVMRKENGAYRIKKDSEIRTVEVAYHDTFILSQIPTQWTKAPMVIDQIIGHSAHTITDTTAEWRIRKLIHSGEVEYKGELKGMNNYALRKV